ncbi:MAG: cytochrome c peroxidase [Pseudomonadota bacterium]
MERLPNLNPEKIALGKQLFHDKKLSHNQKMNCASCHNLNQGGVDNVRFATDAYGNKLNINTLSVFNTAFNVGLFWDGRGKGEPSYHTALLDHIRLLSKSVKYMIKDLKQDGFYQSQVKKLYRTELTEDVIVDALKSYLYSLVALNSKFDQYLKGNQQALTEQEKQGYYLFKVYGCISCHQGKNIGGNVFQKFGIIVPYFSKREAGNKTSLGRYNVTKDERDKNTFKVPSLRNVALTYPYYHNGKTASLEQAVYEMGLYQLGRKIEKQNVAAIVAFLKTLTGEPPKPGPKNSEKTDEGL